jgi:hypothetical protein
MFDYRIFYPQLGIEEQNRNRRMASSASAQRIFRLGADRRDTRPTARR